MAKRRSKKTGGNLAAIREVRNLDLHFNNMHDYTNYLEVIWAKMPKMYKDNILEFAGQEEIGMFDKLINGTHEYLERFNHKAHVLEVHGANNEYYNDVTGLFFDTVIFVTGSPECWLDNSMNIENKFLTIYVNASYSGGTSEEEVFNKFVTIAALIDNLESSGTRVELIICSNGTSNDVWQNKYDGNTNLSVKVKKHGDILNIQALVYQLCSTAMLRIASFITRYDLVGQYYGAYICRAKDEKKGFINDVLYIPSMYWDNANGISWSNTIPVNGYIDSLK